MVRVEEEVRISVVGDEMAHVESGKGERKPGSSGLQVQRVDKCYEWGRAAQSKRNVAVASLPLLWHLQIPSCTGAL